jgi:hypothetical protein
MTRSVRVAAAAMLAVGGLIAAGCSSPDRPGIQARFQDLNGNNGWPERNNNLARQSVLHPFETQMNNAEVFNGVLNNQDFDSGTDKLNGVGRDKLDRHARKMPAPNSKVYLQTAGDVSYDPSNPDKVSVIRNELDQKRSQAVLTYLNTRPNTRGTAFEVTTIDVDNVGVNAAGPATSVRGLNSQYRSTLNGAVGGALVGVGGGQAVGTIGVTPVQSTGGTGTGGGAGQGGTSGTR